MSIRVEEYGQHDNRAIHAITLESERLRAVLIDQGARLLELHAPDRDGQHADLVLGHPDMAAHAGDKTYFGATCGRYANRIGRSTFSLDEDVVHLDSNEGSNHLHGGPVGFDRHRWDFDVDEGHNRVTFRLASPDGDQGYPGELRTTTEYALGETTLDIRMTAVTTEPTVLNLVHHSYWNLGGHDAGDVLGHRLQVESGFFTPVDEELITTGEILSVAGTPFDFRDALEIGARIQELDHDGAGRDSPAGFAGYDHNWVVRGQIGSMRHCAAVHEPSTGRGMTLWTNEAGVQIYTGGYLAGQAGKNGVTYAPFQGFTLETQRFPDSPNHGHFPSSVLRPGALYDHRMRFEFSAG